MDIDFDAVKETYEFASMAPEGQVDGYVNTETGETILHSEYADLDELPDDIDDEKYLRLPSQKDLNLGRTLVIEFAREHLPTDVEQVFEIFRRKSAYGRFKNLLDDRGLLKVWYAFEDEALEKALREWCQREGLSIK